VIKEKIFHSPTLILSQGWRYGFKAGDSSVKQESWHPYRVYNFKLIFKQYFKNKKFQKIFTIIGTNFLIFQLIKITVNYLNFDAVIMTEMIDLFFGTIADLLY
jgi:hypothetical protein